MIYLVEDDDNIRKLVCYALSKDGHDVKDFPEPTSFWKEIHTEIPDAVILDIMLPGEDGITIMQKLRNNLSTKSLPIILLTAKSSEFDKVSGLDLGADDYITKPFGITELVSRVNALLRRTAMYSGKASEYKVGTLYVNAEKHIIKVDGENINLSYKEYLLLLELLKAEGAVVTRDKLLTKVWGEYYEESRTLDVHIRKLRVKLGSAGAMIQTVKNIGYKFAELA